MVSVRIAFIGGINGFSKKGNAQQPMRPTLRRHGVQKFQQRGHVVETGVTDPDG